MAESLKNKTLKGLAWSSLERFSVQGIQFLVMLIIARILSPKEYGLIGMLAIFIAVSQSLIDSGFSQALIRKKNRTDADNCTVFYFNVVVSLILYCVLFMMAPWVADFYDEPQLTSLMRILCIEIVISSFTVVQRALYTATINFKTQAKATLTASIISGVVGIVCALRGMGAWALVFHHLTSNLTNAVLLWYFSSWHPRMSFSWVSFQELFAFGSKLAVSGILNEAYKNVYTLVVGKMFSATNLGYYTRASHFAGFPSNNLTTILQRVTYPFLCSVSEEKLPHHYRQLLRVSAFVVFPLMCLMAAIAYPMTVFFLGEKWRYAATLLVPICFARMLYPIHAINLNLLQVKGRSDLFLKLEIAKKVVGIFILVFSIQFGLLAMCYIAIFSSFLFLIINTYYTGKLINVGIYIQLRDILPTTIVSLAMFVVSHFSVVLLCNNLMALAVGLFVGSFFYIGVVSLFNFSEWSYLKSLIVKKK